MRKTVYSQSYRILLDQLVAARKAEGLTQQELGDRLKRPQSFVAKIERGERRLDVIEFLQVADAVGADPLKIVRAVQKALN